MKNKFRMLLLSMATFGLFSCSDNLTDDVVSVDDVTGYVAFRISTIGNETRATRAAEDYPADDKFDSGNAKEYEITGTIGANVAYFFDDNGDYVASSVLEIVGGADDSQENDSDHNNANEKEYQARINNGNTNVTQCLLILNGNPSTLAALKQKSLAGILAEIDKEDMGWGETKYFTMSNSVYMTADNKVKTTTPIDAATQICPTPEQAKNNAITVHVERILAKFELLYNANPISGSVLIEPSASSTDNDANKKITIYRKNSQGTYEATDYFWAAYINGWYVNGTETETFWFKNLENATEQPTAPDWKYGYWKRDIDGGVFGWNDITRLRSYWAVDPHYNGGDETKAIYPQQYREALDNTDIVSASGGSQGTFALNYYSYNKINETLNYPEELHKYRYAVENTFNYGWFNTNNGSDQAKYQFEGDDYRRTSTHIIVAAELRIKENGSSSGYANIGTLYQYNTYYWEAENVTNYAGYNDMPVDLKKAMLNQLVFEWEIENGSLYKDNGGNERLGDGETDYDYFTWEAATLKGGDGRVMMKLKNDASHALYYKDGSVVRKLEGNKLTEFTEIYLYVYGSARRFDKGAMYYSIPIRHMMATETTTNNSVTAHKYNVGSYGVVRNHWYKATINRITKPGTSVDDPDQPIIPNDDPDAGGYASFEIVIVPWHLVDWTVDF